jgi:hypothetical protein
MSFGKGSQSNANNRRSGKHNGGKQPSEVGQKLAKKRKQDDAESLETEKEDSDEEEEERDPRVKYTVQRTSKQSSSSNNTRSKHSGGSGSNENMDENSDALRSNESRVNKIIVTEKHKDFVSNMMERGVFQEPESIREVIKRYVNGTLFRELKFIGHESQMEFRGRLACKILLDCAIQPEYQLEFWDKHKAFINTTIRTKRNNINMTLKENYMST